MRFVRTHAHVHTLMMQKLCAVGMCNAILRNYLKALLVTNSETATEVSEVYRQSTLDSPTVAGSPVFRSSLSVLFKPKPAVSVEKHTYRNLKAADIAKFRIDLRKSELCLDPSSTLENLSSCYNATLADILNRPLAYV